eukprot:TRINITY_DN40084_c1_g1_i1.p1 TRINITY_DN40084_c1_g1~~TRINITY_DN40084_c1_g1_i1.p1  ORF type:complete len:702 (-),score=121.60 TRINITY_DN40084_c1_g1_i1:48-2105(-)
MAAELERTHSAVQMGKLNFRRLMREFRLVKTASSQDDYMWISTCEPVEDSLLTWKMEITFPEDSPMQLSLEDLAKSLLDETRNKQSLEIRFPHEYPFAPPEVWLRHPRVTYQSAPVTFGGKICNPLLTSQGWSASVGMLEVLREVRSALVEAGARVDVGVSIKKGYDCAPAPIGLDRLKSSLFPQVGNFRKPELKVLSASVAEPWVGDVSRLEYTDKIMLPFQFAEEVYGGDVFQEGIMFEVKTSVGRKTHCALMDFVHGIPPEFVLLPKWVMDDLFIQERESVSVRAVQLELCSFVKFQPHSVEFYEAVQKSGQDAKMLLRQSLRRFSALTEDTSVPIEIEGKSYRMQIVECRPQAGVKIIAHDEFEIPVDFDPAPDLEDAAAVKARDEALIERYKALRDKNENDASAAKERRSAELLRHFELLKTRIVAETSEYEWRGGDIDVALRLPGGAMLRESFPEGAPAATLYVMAVKSEWASEKHPWDVQLMTTFPRRILAMEDKISSDMHRSVVSVREVNPPDEEELARVLEEEGRDDTCKKVGVAAEEAEGYELPEIDESLVHERTRQAYEIQRFLRSGVSLQEALQRFEAGEVLPLSAEEIAAGQAPSPESSAPRRPAPEIARERSVRRRNEEEEGQERTIEQEQQIQDLMCFTGFTRDEAILLLEQTGWNVEAAVNRALDQTLG